MDDAGALFDPDSLFRPVPAVPVDLAPPVAPGEPVPVSLPSDPAHHDSAEPTGLAGLGQMVHEADPADGSHAAAQRDQMSMKIVLFIALGMALVVVIAVLLILL